MSVSRRIIPLLLAIARCVSEAQAQPSKPGAPARDRSLASTQLASRTARLERTFDSLRVALRIPGMAAVILDHQEVVWRQGFGVRDVDTRAPATPDTPFEIASLVKPISATLLLRLVEQGRLSLDDPMSKYLTSFTGDAVTVRHVLTHTSQGVPGTAYQYNGNIFATLFDVLVKASGLRFRVLLTDSLLTRIGAQHSVPGNDLGTNPEPLIPILGEANVLHFSAVMKELTSTYKLFGEEVVKTTNRQSGLSPANGLIASATDLARFDAALDRGDLVRPATLEQMWTPMRSRAGKTLPYGLGWFVNRLGNTRLVWHYGYLPDVTSTLYIKLPKEQLTLILLANTDAMSAPFRLGRGEITSSPFACAFLREFMSGKRGDRRVHEKAPDCEPRGHSLAVQWLDSARVNTPHARSIDERLVQQYLGAYEVSPGVSVRIRRDGERLVRESPSGVVELLAMSDSAFFAKEPFAIYTFVRDAAGRVTELVVRRNGLETHARRTNDGTRP